MTDVPRRCATHDLSFADAARMADLESGFRTASRAAKTTRSLTIPVRFIHITDGADGRITPQQRADQIAKMNDCFAPAGLTFDYDEDETSEIDDPTLFTMGHKSFAERQCKSAHQAIDPTKGLNFYTAHPAGGILGWATFPHEMAGDPDMDGVVMLDSTLPGGASQNYNLGITAVHEIGHWLGLYHTFQGGCFPPGDHVDDTPPHMGPNFGTPDEAGQPWNLCPGQPAGTKCPIHNYMNYCNDSNLTEFTPGQIDRIWAQVGMFRSELLAHPLAAKEADFGFAAPVVW